MNGHTKDNNLCVVSSEELETGATVGLVLGVTAIALVIIISIAAYIKRKNENNEG